MLDDDILSHLNRIYAMLKVDIIEIEGTAAAFCRRLCVETSAVTRISVELGKAFTFIFTTSACSC